VLLLLLLLPLLLLCCGAFHFGQRYHFRQARA